MLFKLQTSFIVAILFIGFDSSALVLPNQLSRSDQQQMVRVLGLTSTPKVLTKPNALGGYSGFEMGAVYEVFSIEQINSLGSGTTKSEPLSSQRISFGKGLYSDFDVFFYFTPPTGYIPFTDYGGIVRWQVLEDQSRGLTLSAALLSNSINFNDQFSNQNFGGQVICGWVLASWSIYAGVGVTQGEGFFLASGSKGIVSSSSDSTNQVVKQTHGLMGVTFERKSWFLATQVDMMTEPVASLKVGYRP